MSISYFAYDGPKVWSELSDEIRSVPILNFHSKILP